LVSGDNLRGATIQEIYTYALLLSLWTHARLEYTVEYTMTYESVISDICNIAAAMHSTACRYISKSL
jgi:hypothetical protein